MRLETARILECEVRTEQCRTIHAGFKSRTGAQRIQLCGRPLGHLVHCLPKEPFGSLMGSLSRREIEQQLQGSVDKGSAHCRRRRLLRESVYGSEPKQQRTGGEVGCT